MIEHLTARTTLWVKQKKKMELTPVKGRVVEDQLRKELLSMC